MPKSKHVVPVVDAPPTSNEEYEGGSPKKKKKKKKRKRSESQEEGEITASVLSQSFSSLSSPGLSPSKKKKKKKRKEEEELDPSVNGVIQMEEDQIVEEKIKKKRKKKVAVKEEESKVEEEVRKKKKKKEKEKEKEKEEELDHKKRKKMGKMIKKEMERDQEENEEGEEASVKSSTKKKSKKKEVMKTSPSRPAQAIKEEGKTKVEENTEEEEDSAWSEEATQELLSRVTRQLPPLSRDTRSCRVSLKTVDWGAAAIPGHSPNACREHFMALYKKINPFKNLTTVVEEMGKLAVSGLSDRRNRPSLPIHRFLKDYFTPEMLATAKRKGENMFKLGHKAWRDLPTEQKEGYIRSYKEDCSKLKPRLNSRDKPQPAIKLPKLPYQLCWDTEGQAGSGLRSRSYYASLTPPQQLPYIRQALEDLMKYVADLQAYLASHPEYQPPSSPALPKIDLKTYLDAHGCPALPPPRPALVFYKEALESGQLTGVPGVRRMSQAMKMYKDLSRQEKAKYREKLEQALWRFEEDLKEWSSGQDEVTLYALKKYREVMPYCRQMGQKKSRHVKADDVFPHKAPAVTSCPKFLAEPPRPPASPYCLFSAKFRASADAMLSGPDLQRALRDGWKALGDEEKAVYISRCRALHKLYEKEVKEYVREMDPKTRRLFLGFNRLLLFRFFGNRDVFAEEFPNSEQYPVLVKGLQDPHHPTSSPTTKLPHQHTQPHATSDDEEDQEEEEEDDEEEEEYEEEEIVPASSSPKKRKLSPILFSSLEAPPSPTIKGSKAKLAPNTTSPKKSKAPTAPPPPLSESESESEEEESEDEEEEVTPAAASQAKKKAPVAAAGKKTKAPPPTPAPEDEDEESEEEEEEEEEEDVNPAWHTGPPAAAPTTTTQAKKQQQHQQQQQQQKQQQQQQQDSSSSGFSDSDSSY